MHKFDIKSLSDMSNKNRKKTYKSIVCIGQKINVNDTAKKVDTNTLVAIDSYTIKIYIFFK